MNNARTACDLLAMEASTKVQQAITGAHTVERKPEQPFSAWYVHNKVAGMTGSMQQVADRLAISRAYLYKLFSGEKRLSDEMVLTMAGALDFTVAELLAARAVDLLEAEVG